MSLKDLMNSLGYNQIVDKATLSTILLHYLLFYLGVYLIKYLFKQSLCNNLQNKVIPVYYLDDDAVQIAIQ